MDALDDAGAGEVVDQLAVLDAGVRLGVDELCLAGASDLDLAVLVDVTIGVSCEHDGLFPGADIGLNAVHEDRSAEDGSVQMGADRRVRGLVELLELVLLHSRPVRGDGGALDGDAVLLCRLCGIQGHLVIGGIAVHQTQIVVVCLQIHVGKDQVVLDHLPDDACHLVSVHLDEGSCSARSGLFSLIAVMIARCSSLEAVARSIVERVFLRMR